MSCVFLVMLLAFSPSWISIGGISVRKTILCAIGFSVVTSILILKLKPSYSADKTLNEQRYNYEHTHSNKFNPVTSLPMVGVSGAKGNPFGGTNRSVSIES